MGPGRSTYRGFLVELEKAVKCPVHQLVPRGVSEPGTLDQEVSYPQCEVDRRYGYSKVHLPVRHVMQLLIGLAHHLSHHGRAGALRSNGADHRADRRYDFKPGSPQLINNQVDWIVGREADEQASSLGVGGDLVHAFRPADATGNRGYGFGSPGFRDAEPGAASHLMLEVNSLRTSSWHRQREALEGLRRAGRRRLVPLTEARPEPLPRTTRNLPRSASRCAWRTSWSYSDRASTKTSWPFSMASALMPRSHSVALKLLRIAILVTARVSRGKAAPTSAPMLIRNPHGTTRSSALSITTPSAAREPRAIADVVSTGTSSTNESCLRCRRRPASMRRQRSH